MSSPIQKPKACVQFNLFNQRTYFISFKYVVSWLQLYLYSGMVYTDSSTCSAEKHYGVISFSKCQILRKTFFNKGFSRILSCLQILRHSFNSLSFANPIFLPHNLILYENRAFLREIVLPLTNLNTKRFKNPS